MSNFLRKKTTPVESTSKVTWVRRDNGFFEVTVHGTIEEKHMQAVQAQGAREIEESGAVSVLVDLRDMQAWAKGPVGANLDFLLTYDEQIKKIAIVADPQQKTNSLAFFGACYRHAKVEFFPPESLNTARRWVVE